MSINYTLNDTDYAISITAQRVGATVDEIVAPTESVSDSLMTFSDILNIIKGRTYHKKKLSLGYSTKVCE